MRFVNDSTHFLGTGGSVTAAAGDLHLDNHEFWVDNCTPAFPIVNYGFIASSPQFTSTWIAPIAEVLQITTLTPTAATAIGQLYKFTIVQFVEGQGYKSQTFSYTSITATDSATVICDAFRAQLRGYALVQVSFNATGNPTLIITALTRSPIFTVTIQSTGAGFTQSTGTAGVHSFGTVPDFQAEGITGYVDGQTYKTLEIIYKSDDNVAAANVTSSQNRARLFVNIAATNFADFNTRMIEIGEAEETDGDADPEAIEIFGALGT